MKEPKVIFLQVGEEYDQQTDSFKETEEVTWCVDSQFDTDIEYHLKSEVDDLKMSVALYEEENQYLLNRIHKLFDVIGNIQEDEWGMDVVDVIIKRLQNK